MRSLLANGVVGVVVWDNSADEGRSAAELGPEIAGDERIRVHVSPENVGFAAGVNRGLELCAQLYPRARVLLINNDARLLPGGLEALVNVLEQHPESKIAFPAINHSGVVGGLSYYHRLTGILSGRPHPGCFPYASGCCMLLATDRLEMPLFDDDFFMYGEDAELGWRLHDRPGAMLFVDQVLVDHDGSASSGLGSAFYEAHMVAAHLILVRKLSDKCAGRIALYTFRMPVLLVRACVRAKRFRSLVPLAALWNGARLAFPRKQVG
jgi:GT2 family glycosyltransferase